MVQVPHRNGLRKECLLGIWSTLTKHTGDILGITSSSHRALGIAPSCTKHERRRVDLVLHALRQPAPLGQLPETRRGQGVTASTGKFHGPKDGSIMMIILCDLGVLKYIFQKRKSPQAMDFPQAALNFAGLWWIVKFWKHTDAFTVYGDGSKPGTPGEHQNSWDLWMFIPLKMVLIGIDP